MTYGNNQDAGSQTENLPVEFTFEEHSVRTFRIGDEIWTIANDACAALDLKNPNQVLTRLDDDEKGVQKVDTLGGPQDLAVVNLSGLVRLITRSNKPEARAFQRWIFHDVVPSIYKTGRYESPQARLDNEKTKPQADLSDRATQADNLDGERDRFDKVFARIEPATLDQKFEWIKEMLITPGRYRISVYYGGKTTAYRSNLGVVLDECNQANTRWLGLILQSIETRWERFRLEQSDFDQIYRHDQIINDLEQEIQRGANIGRLVIAHLDAKAF